MTRDYARVILQVANEIWARALRVHRDHWQHEQERRIQERAQARLDADKSALPLANLRPTVTKYGL